MPNVVFAPAIQRHVSSPPRRVSARTVRAALDAVFAEQTALRDYILDEQGALRCHVAIFVDQRKIDASQLADAVADSAEIYVVQALSGG
jgi:sulfur-carrier protein